MPDREIACLKCKHFERIEKGRVYCCRREPVLKRHIQHIVWEKICDFYLLKETCS